MVSLFMKKNRHQRFFMLICIFSFQVNLACKNAWKGESGGWGSGPGDALGIFVNTVELDVHVIISYLKRSLRILLFLLTSPSQKIQASYTLNGHKINHICLKYISAIKSTPDIKWRYLFTSNVFAGPIPHVPNNRRHTF